MVYGADFMLMSFATHYFNADSPAEAAEIARKLHDNDRFFDEQLRDRFDIFPIRAENMADLDVVFDADGMEPTLDDDEVALYTAELA